MGLRVALMLHSPRGKLFAEVGLLAGHELALLLLQLAFGPHHRLLVHSASDQPQTGRRAEGIDYLTQRLSRVAEHAVEPQPDAPIKDGNPCPAEVSLTAADRDGRPPPQRDA
ncbi:hypothetical protein GCM10009716_49410 [Streptomyces sodiiphilus]|uniref:Uncharacterized protein n=1 Tax=Streptomyces sodiiphilus TaxID=226217 RepID=A0ABN2PYE0_9ACTN